MIIGLIIQGLIIFSFLYGIRFSKTQTVFMSKEYTERFKWLSCWIVVLSHIGTSEKYHIIGCFHFVFVTLFFLLSGYGLTCSCQKDKNSFIKKMPMRVLKLLLYFTIVWVLALILNVNLIERGILFIPVILVFYIIYLFLVILIKNMKVFSIVSFITYVLVIPFTMQFLIKQNYWNSSMWGFGLGIIIAMYCEKIEQLLHKHTIIITVVSLVILCPLGWKYYCIRDISTVNNMEFLIRGLLTFLMLLIMFSLSTHFVFEKNFFWGGNSLYVYLVHGLVIGMIDKVIYIEYYPEAFMVAVVLCIMILIIIRKIIIKTINNIVIK